MVAKQVQKQAEYSKGITIVQVKGRYHIKKGLDYLTASRDPEYPMYNTWISPTDNWISITDFISYTTFSTRSDAEYKLRQYVSDKKAREAFENEF